MAVGGTNKELAEKLYQKIEERRGQGTALSFAIIKDGEIIASAAAGTVDGDPEKPITLDDVFNVGSVSKVYCAMAVLKLVEQGKVELDAPVYKYLPRFKMLDERYKLITLRHCLNHTSGLPGTDYYASFMSDPTDIDVFYEHFYKYLSLSELKADPGEYEVYCNDGFVLAQVVVAEVSGMPYTDFVQKYLMYPIGCRSVCSGENNADNRRLVKMKGRSTERIMVVGTGGITTTMEDCARFAWEFIEPGRIFSAADVAETRKRAEVTRILKGCEPRNGLGWDNVDFRGKGVDLGKGTLGKGGNTLQFSAYMLASEELRLSAAIAATNDCGLDQTKLLCELIADALGMEIEKPEAPEKKPIPAGYIEKYTGRYYSSTAVWDVSFEDDCVNVKRPMKDQTIDFVKDAPFTGEAFWFDGQKVDFLEDDRGYKFFCLGTEDGMTSFGEIPPALPAIDEAWLARDGKQYVMCDAFYSDHIASGLYGSTQVSCDKEKGMINFILHGSLMPYASFPVVSVDANRTKNFLVGPGSSSRDTSAPCVWMENGAEHLFMYGFEYIETGALDELKPGNYVLGSRACRPLRVPDGKTLRLEYGSARIVALDKELNVKADSFNAGFNGEVGEGYVIILTYEPETVKVKSLEETGAVGGKDVAFAEKAYRKMTEKRGKGTAISFALIKEGEVVAKAATGTRGGDPKDPVTVNDLFNIGSTSKVYCTMAIMKLVEMGLVELDAPVCRYIPDFKMDDPRYKDITVRHCLNHSSALPGTDYSMGFMTKFCDRHTYNASFLDYISKGKLKADPGEYSVYCNDGFIVAQLVVEYVTGMSLTTFLQKHILGPIGAVSTCSGENNPDNRVLVHMPDRAPEKIMIVGTGGISTDMTDCARFGWQFIEPGKVFSAESVAETAKHQKTARTIPGYQDPYGLGWDDVALKVAGFDLGEGCLVKGGTTLQFHSHLIISKDRRLVGALSATADIGVDTIGFLSELMADYEGEEYKVAEQPEKQPLPEGYAEKFSGIYYSSMTTDEYVINENGLTHRLLMAGADPIELAKDAPFVGNGFWVDGALLSFIEGPDGVCYLVRPMMADLNPYIGAEKPLAQPPINDAWLARDGKKYFNVSANAYDVIVAGLYATTKILCAKDENVIKFIEHGKLAPYGEMHAISETDDTTGLFKHAPGMASRDTFAPYTWKVGEFEHLYMYGYEFVEEAGVETLSAGEISVPAGTCRPYVIPEGKKFSVCQGDARIIVLDKGQNVLADSMDTGDVKEVSEGYILVLTDGAATLRFTE